MASPHYNGIDERNGFLPVVDTVTDLQAQAGGYPGRAVYVLSLRQVFELDPFSVETADGFSIIACTSGGMWKAPVTDATILRNAQGILAETGSRHTSPASSSGLVTQTAYFSGIILRAGTVVTNITVYVIGAGSAVTVSKVGLYSSAGVQLAVSADQGTNWHSTGHKTIAMAAPYTVLTTGFYYVCLLCVFTGTQLFFVRHSTTSGGVNVNAAIGSGVIPYGVQLSQSDMPSPATIVGGTSTAFGVWGAIT